MKTTALSYEDIPFKASKGAEKRYNSKETTTTLNRIDTGVIIWHLVKRHKFALLATFTAIYVIFTLFGTLIVGLVQSF